MKWNKKYKFNSSYFCHLVQEDQIPYNARYSINILHMHLISFSSPAVILKFPH
jgi:hypothetical protein